MAVKKKEVNIIKCTCCGEEKKETDFYSSYSKIFKSIGKICICKDCIIKIFEDYNEKFKNENATIYRMCEILDVYYDEPLIEPARIQAEKKSSSPIQIYMQKINSLPQYKGKTFEDRLYIYENPKQIVDDEISSIELTEEEEKAKEDVKRLLGYDPFDGYEIIDKKYLYTELVSYLDEDTLEDPFKISVIIQIVNNTNQIRKTSLAINTLTISPDSMVTNSKTISDLTDITTKLNVQNDRLSKENNIALKHRGGANSKNSTLGSMMKNLRELGFEKAEHDYYDMCKAYGMKQSADISNSSLLEILHFDENDFNNMFKMQREELQKLQEKELDYKEQIRVLVKENIELKSKS